MSRNHPARARDSGVRSAGGAARAFRFSAGSQRTEVVVGQGALASLGPRLARIARGRWLAVSSEPVFALHGRAFLAGAAGADLAAEPLFLPDGEHAKSWPVLGALLSTLVKSGLRRDGGVVALGGGTVGDVAGLAASLALRGVPVVHVPTTLLAASDSALGGKTAVNLAAGKNLAGTVHQPRLVLADVSCLRTLPERQLRSGLAEVVKSSMLDARFDEDFAALERDLLAGRPAALAEAVFRSLRLKARVVAADPLETRGIRFSLNLGHTLGHALETASRHRLAHGEAVAWGLLAILELSRERAGLPARTAERLAGRVLRLVDPPPPAAGRGWTVHVGADKKGDKKGLRLVLLARPGRAVTLRMPVEDLALSFETVTKRYNQG